MSEMISVSADEFFAYVGPRDVVLHTEPAHTVWEARNRVVVGISYPGYRNPGDAKVYMLARAALDRKEPKT